MIRIYPAPDVMEGLAEEVKNIQDGEQWDKGEEYFIKLINNRTIKQRLIIWQFKLEFPDKRDLVSNTIRSFDTAFDELRDSVYLKKIFGYILALGNIMNGGTAKGQADGFYLEALSKVTTTKDINNRTIM